MKGTLCARALCSTYAPSHFGPLFLMPALASLCTPTTIQFQLRTFASTNKQCQKHRSREKNKKRGVSAIRRTGPRVPLSVAKYELPRPSTDSEERRKEFKTNPDHGLWGFFYDKQKAMLESVEMHAHGRAWTYAELSRKSFEDLHALYWVSIYERNRIETSRREQDRRRAGYGQYEIDERVEEVSHTMSRIRAVLRDRWDSWEQANTIVKWTTIENLKLDEEAETSNEQI